MEQTTLEGQLQHAFSEFIQFSEELIVDPRQRALWHEKLSYILSLRQQIVDTGGGTIGGMYESVLPHVLLIPPQPDSQIKEYQIYPQTKTERNEIEQHEREQE